MASNDQDPSIASSTTQNASGTNGHQVHPAAGKPHTPPPPDAQPGVEADQLPQKAVKKGPNPLCS